MCSGHCHHHPLVNSRSKPLLLPNTQTPLKLDAIRGCSTAWGIRGCSTAWNWYPQPPDHSAMLGTVGHLVRHERRHSVYVQICLHLVLLHHLGYGVKLLLLNPLCNLLHLLVTLHLSLKRPHKRGHSAGSSASASELNHLHIALMHLPDSSISELNPPHLSLAEHPLSFSCTFYSKEGNP